MLLTGVTGVGLLLGELLKCVLLIAGVLVLTVLLESCVLLVLLVISGPAK